MKQQKSNPTPNPEWFVTASICTRGHIATTVIEAALAPDTTPNTTADEITLTGQCWPVLVDIAATTLARFTGRRISGSCASIYVTDQTQQNQLQLQLITHVCHLADEQAELAELLGGNTQ